MFPTQTRSSSNFTPAATRPPARPEIVATGRQQSYVKGERAEAKNPDPIAERLDLAENVRQQEHGLALGDTRQDAAGNHASGGGHDDQRDAHRREFELLPGWRTPSLRRRELSLGGCSDAQTPPPEFRRRAVELARLHEKPIAQIAEDLGISDSCLAGLDTPQVPASFSGDRITQPSDRSVGWGDVVTVPAGSMTLPIVIQGGMGVAVSDWRLARAVGRLGQLGVVSGTALDVVHARRLADGDPGGHLRRAYAHFPVPSVAERVIGRWSIPGVRAANERYRRGPAFCPGAQAAPWG